jgi:hypothetical protein
MSLMALRCDLKSADKPPKKEYQVDQTLIYEGQENLSRIWGAVEQGMKSTRTGNTYLARPNKASRLVVEYYPTRIFF